MRVSFTGELGYEINVPAGYGRDVWEAAWREVEKHGGCAYGTEAMHVMRAEKGYVIVGQDTDGTVTLADLGLDWAIGKTKKDFVGKRSLSRADMRQGRPQAARRPPHRRSRTSSLRRARRSRRARRRRVGSPALGHVTSSYRSATLGPLDRAGARRRRALADRDEALRRRCRRAPSAATVTAPVFYDKEGARLHV